MHVFTAIYASKIKARLVQGVQRQCCDQVSATTTSSAGSSAHHWAAAVGSQSCLCSWFLCAWLIGYRVIFLKAILTKHLKMFPLQRIGSGPSLFLAFIFAMLFFSAPPLTKFLFVFWKQGFFSKRKTSITALKISQVYLLSVCFLNRKIPYVLQSLEKSGA